MWRGLLRGAAAGAVGTAALNAVTYADMAWRGRAASSTPARVVERIAEQIGADVPGDGEARGNRLSALGALSGMAVGVGVGAAYGLLTPRRLQPPVLLGGVALGALAMAASDLPAVRLGITDPRTWTAADWASDVFPHLAYGLATARALSRADSTT